MVNFRNVFTMGGRFGFFKFTVTVISSWSTMGHGIVSDCNMDWSLLVTIKSMRVAEVGSRDSRGFTYNLCQFGIRNYLLHLTAVR